MMRWIETRPLTLFAACYAVGLGVGLWAELPAVWFLAPAVGVLGLFVWRRRAVLVFSAALLMGAGLMALASQGAEVRLAPGRYEITGNVVSCSVNDSGRGSVLVADAYLDGAPAPGRVLLYVDAWRGEPLLYGDRVRVAARMWLPEDDENLSAFSYRAYLLRQRVHICGSASFADLAVTGADASLMRTLASFRLRLADLADELYGAETACLVKALVLGDRTDLPKDMEDRFRASGVVHLLALSGLHISILALALTRLLRYLRMPNAVSYVLALSLLALYAAMVGLTASVLRATIMYAVSGWGRLRKRPCDTLTSLSAAFLALTLPDPLRALDAGLLLSFSAVLGILLVSDWFRVWAHTGLGRIGAKLWRAAGVSVGASLACAPTIAALYLTAQLYAIVTNLIAVPIVGVALPICFISLGLGMINPGLGKCASFLAEKLLAGVRHTTSFVASLPGATISAPPWDAGLVCLFAILMLLASPYLFRKKAWRVPPLILSLLIAVFVFVRPHFVRPGGLTLVFLDAGQADAAVIWSDGQAYLVDAGEDESAARYLRAQSAMPEAVFLTHPHADHALGFYDVMEIGASTLYLPEGWRTCESDGSVSTLAEDARAAGWTVIYLAKGAKIDLGGGATAEVIRADGDENEMSLLLLVRAGEASALFTGDLPAEAEPILPDCDVLKVSHHGANNGTSALTALSASPSVAVISVGRNSYGHPNGGVIALLEDAGAAVFRTDERGDVTVSLSPDGTATVSCEK